MGQKVGQTHTADDPLEVVSAYLVIALETDTPIWNVSIRERQPEKEKGAGVAEMNSYIVAIATNLVELVAFLQGLAQTGDVLDNYHHTATLRAAMPGSP